MSKKIMIKEASQELFTVQVSFMLTFIKKEGQNNV